MAAYKIHMEGQVQGVGFRPLVFRVASELGLTGEVSNGPDGVNIVVIGDEWACQAFYSIILTRPPKYAHITGHSMQPTTAGSYTTFSITGSTDGKPTNLLLTPDLAMCDNCRRELHDRENRRYQYPFTTCLLCGPRYSIIRQLPYDRARTTMESFVMCPSCQKEYNNPLIRRHYSQTNSCRDCAVELSITDKKGQLITNNPDAVIQMMVDIIEDGFLLAVKGIGGFLIMADPSNADAVNLLRARKKRPSKPFALLYPSIESVRKDMQVSEQEERALTSEQSPIVLLTRKVNAATTYRQELIAPGLNRIGVMLPYAPLLEILMRKWGKPLIATSGNVSRSPIVYENERAVQSLGSIVDFIVMNNRDIVVPQDDSVVQYTNEFQQPVFIRRSRGYAPTLLPNPLSATDAILLGMGGELKSTCALHVGEHVYVSQYLGDLGSYDTQQAFEHTLNHLLNVLNVQPDKIIVDSHPEYFSSQLGKAIAARHTLELHEVQHHTAHFGAVLAENKLMESEGPILGVIWDGTGWGTDGAIWGGEFFSYHNKSFHRLAHLDYFPHILGDKLSQEPRLSALAHSREIPDADSILAPKFSQPEWKYFNQLLATDKHLLSSSMGRLFDAVSSLLGACDLSSYEGEAAMYLETLASRISLDLSPYPVGVNTHTLLSSVIQDIRRHRPAEHIAYRFHRTLIKWIDDVARKERMNRIAFSGGVFQNGLLVDMIRKHLADDYDLFFHKRLSPNDECISVGQLACYHIEQAKRKDVSAQLSELIL